jgi:hypothetical protein
MKNKKPKVCLFVCLWIEVLCYVVPLQLIVLREFQNCLMELVSISPHYLTIHYGLSFLQLV